MGPGILHHSTSEEREEAPWGLPGGPQAAAHPDPIPTDTQDPFLCTARPLAQCPQSTASEHRDSWGRMGSTLRIQPGRQAELPALSQKPVSGEEVSQRVGRGGELSLAPQSVQTLHLWGGGATEGIPFLSGPLLSFPISFLHSFSQSSAYVVSIQGLVLGAGDPWENQLPSRGSQSKGRDGHQRSGKCYSREMNEEYRGGRGPRIFKE